MGIGTKIEARRKELGLTLEQVGNYVGVSKSTVKKWETGYIANMKRDKISLLAKVLQMSPSEFINEDLSKEINTKDDSTLSNISGAIPQDKIYNIPVFATVSAGLGAFAEDEIVEYIPMVIDNPYDVADTFGLQVRGDSMYPKIEDGDIIVVRRQTSVDSGTIAVMLLDGEEGLVKKVIYDKHSIELHSINPEYKTRVFEGAEVERLRVVGKVLKVVKTL